jgi:sugar/nucleoside kinase (ribokinase family)
MIQMSVLCSGSYLVDFIIPDLLRIGGPGTLTYAPKGIHIFPGGHSANVSISLCRLKQKTVHSVGCTGRDLWHNYIHESLITEGVQTHECRIEGTTAKNIALIVKGEDRRFIAELTSNSKLPLKLVKNLIEEITPTIFYQGTIGGLTYIDPKLKELLNHAKNQDCLTFVDVIPPVNGWEHLHKSLSEIDFLHCNIEEGLSFSGLCDPLNIAKYLVKKGVGIALVSQGKEGAVLGNKLFTLSMPAFNALEADPTGAGDAFCAGIIHEIINSKFFDMMDLETSVNILLTAQAVGAACITSYGASTGVTKDKVDKLITTQREKILDQTVIDSQ